MQTGKQLVPHLVLNVADADRSINVFGLIERRSYGGTKDKPILGADVSEKLAFAVAP